MVNVDTHFITPQPLLKPYVKHFAVRKFDTGEVAFSKAMTVEHEMAISFHLDCRVFNFEALGNEKPLYVINKNSTADCCLLGIQTSTKGFVVYKGQITLLNIQFTPVGFFYLFGISPKELLDTITDTKNILPYEIEFLQEQLHDLKDISSCIAHLEIYLSKKLINQKPRYKHKGITEASQFLLKQKGIYSIKKLASDCNMTMQTFEVQFKEQVGVNPIYYSRILRLNSAVNLKLYNPFRSWTEIAYLTGYYDQVHLIKDFKAFTSFSPLHFMREMHPPLENFQKNSLLVSLISIIASVGSYFSRCDIIIDCLSV